MKTPKARILIVDDEEGFTKLTKLALTDYEVEEENISARALETARRFKPDLILLDVMMPEFDGGDVAAQLRADETLREVPIVFLTAIVTQKETSRRPTLGGYPFISKPVMVADLAEHIEKHLRVAGNKEAEPAA
jgi:two-component system OmpR family response regulator